MGKSQDLEIIRTSNKVKQHMIFNYTINYFRSGLVLILLTLCSHIQVALGQNNSTDSPYSRYGIGDLAKANLGQSRSMGGIGIGLRSNRHLNLINPASYSAIDSLSFIFEMGVTDKITNYKTNTINITSQNANLSHIALGFPVTKWWFGCIGLFPVSDVGYKMSDSDSLPNIGKFDTEYSGTGGINRFNWGNTIKILKNLSVGVNASYIFGSMEYARKLFFDDLKSYDFYKFDTLNVSGLYFGFGAQYTAKLKNDLSLTAGAIFDNRKPVTAYRTQLVQTLGNSTTNTIYHPENEKGTIDLPMNIGLGVSLTDNDKFVAGADFYQQNWSNCEIMGQTDSLKNSNFIGVGAEYTPNANSINNFFQRIRYRIGGHYSSTYLNLNGTQLSDYGVSIGFGIPLRRTSFNIAVELGQRGTISNNLIRETYCNISLNIALVDTWFIKRKFD